MKRLILIVLVLIPMISLGQGFTALEYGDVKEEMWFSEICEEGLKRVTAELFIEYKEFCYNDSSESGIEWWIVLDTFYVREKDLYGVDSFLFQDEYITMDTIVSPYRKKSLYHHRKPTFENFLEWVEDNY